MRPLSLILILVVYAHSSFAEPSCQLFPVTRTDLVQIKMVNQDIKSLSRTVNEALKSSYGLLSKIDRATYGLASAYLLGGKNLDMIEPSEWNKARFVGALVYQDQPFSMAALRGTTIRISDQNKKSWKLTTGTHGEFSLHLYELVPYERLRLFPGIIIDRGNKFRKTVRVPVTVEVDSPLCQAKIKLEELPIEPVTLIATQADEKVTK